MAIEYGTTAANYNPTVITYSGMIGKIAKQVIEGEGINSKFSVFEKENMEFGKDLEVALYQAATGQTYSRTTPANAPDPAKKVLLFTSATDKSYGVTIDKREIDKSARDASAATRNAEIVVDTLYQGAARDENDIIMSLFTLATAGAATSAGTTQIVDYGDAAEVTDKTTAEAWVALIKKAANGMRAGASKFNPYAMRVATGNVVMLIPYDKKADIETYLLAQSQGPDYLKYGVDAIIEYDPDEYSAASGAVFLVDDRWVQWCKTDDDTYLEDLIAGCANIKAYLHTFRQYAACPLFNAVKISEADTE